jgi:hypothetical protein
MPTGKPDFSSQALTYATKGNILTPGTQAQADATERRAEDDAEERLGVGSTVLLNTLVIQPGG